MPANFTEQQVEDMMIAAGKANGWKYISADELPRQESEVMVESMVKAALIRLNPCIAEKPENADTVIYRLRALISTVQPHDTLMWDGDYYYLRGYCDERQAMRTFRLDRIEKQPDVLRDAALSKPENYSIAEYSKSVFRMFDTDEPVEVTLLCSTSNMKVIIDNFGMDVDTTPIDKEHFQVRVKVCTSPTFYRWVFGFGRSIKILGPDKVVEKYKDMCMETLSAYGE